MVLQHIDFRRQEERRLELREELQTVQEYVRTVSLPIYGSANPASLERGRDEDVYRAWYRSNYDFLWAHGKLRTLRAHLAESADMSVQGSKKALDALKIAQNVFRRVTGACFSGIPSIPITPQHTMSTIYDLHQECCDLYEFRHNRYEFRLMLELYEVYTDWKLAEEALRPCLEMLHTHDRPTESSVDSLINGHDECTHV